MQAYAPRTASSRRDAPCENPPVMRLRTHTSPFRPLIGLIQLRFVMPWSWVGHPSATAAERRGWAHVVAFWTQSLPKGPGSKWRRGPALHPEGGGGGVYYQAVTGEARTTPFRVTTAQTSLGRREREAPAAENCPTVSSPLPLNPLEIYCHALSRRPPCRGGAASH